MKKIKKLKFIICISCFLILLGIFYLSNKCLIHNLIVNSSSFSSEDGRIYFSPGISQTKKDSITDLVNGAVKQNNLFWSAQGFKYQIIFCSSNDELKRYSNGVSTVTICSILGNYTIISQNYANLDIISHELCHSFLNQKIGFFNKRKLPTWFDEGIAMQLDNRAYFCDSLIERNYKTDTILLNRISSNATFYNPSKVTIRNNYIIAKCEVRNWINHKGINKFYQLIDLLGDGRKFSEVYK